MVGLIALGFGIYHPILLSVVAAHLGHVATDHLHNRLGPWSYFLTYRILTGFDVSRIAPNHDVLHSYKFWPGMLPFGKQIEPWYRRKVEPWFRSRISS